jgi:capsular polysaccharide biosynthesis protein
MALDQFRNNEVVQALLEKNGIIGISPEDFSFKGQTSFAARSRFAFGAHGSGLLLSLHATRVDSG